MTPLLFELKSRSLIWSKLCARTPGGLDQFVAELADEIATSGNEER
jgi:hypothetical protein